MTDPSKTTEGQKLLLLSARWSWDNDPEITPQTPYNQLAKRTSLCPLSLPTCPPERVLSLNTSLLTSPPILISQSLSATKQEPTLWPHKDGHRQFINEPVQLYSSKSSLIKTDRWPVGSTLLSPDFSYISASSSGLF